MAYFGRLPYNYPTPFNVALDQGNQTTPPLAFIGDTNNGIFSPALDNLAVTTNGSEKLRVIANGNVGIATTNPQYKLHVNGTINITGGFYVNGTLVNLTSIDYGLITGSVDSSTDYGSLT